MSSLKLKNEYLLPAKIRILYEMVKIEPWSRLPLHFHWISDKYKRYADGCPSIPLHFGFFTGPLDELYIYKKGLKSVHDVDDEDDKNMRDDEYDDDEEEDVQNHHNSSSRTNLWDDDYMCIDNNDDDDDHHGIGLTTTHSRSYNRLFNESYLDQTQKSNLGRCIICKYSMSNRDCTIQSTCCKTVTHMHCLAVSFLEENLQGDMKGTHLLPTIGSCRSCKSIIVWHEMIEMKKRKKLITSNQPKIIDIDKLASTSI
eukprot:TRINITY_DN458_c2_g2_i3.p1 TRINITY_DN458_c2_g2~~TRINITY_DN458_c2_g2_i3.p1  ORF type:complete len:256 (+),score=35.00 TRINITY_DN458_c2_g2_i3:352-1119(+)